MQRSWIARIVSRRSQPSGQETSDFPSNRYCSRTGIAMACACDCDSFACMNVLRPPTSSLHRPSPTATLIPSSQLQCTVGCQERIEPYSVLGNNSECVPYVSFTYSVYMRDNWSDKDKNATPYGPAQKQREEQALDCIDERILDERLLSNKLSLTIAS